MAACKICEWFSRLFRSKTDSKCSDVWRRIYDWDRAAAGDIDKWWDEPHFVRLQAVASLWDDQPEAAFQNYKELADLGSVHALIWLGHCYARGHGTEVSFDNAYDSYDRAISAGSWLATLEIAELLFDYGCDEECISFLEHGVESDFIPASFWLARYKIKRSWSRKTFEAVRPLLVSATKNGHPGAEALLAAVMILGRYGIREMRTGWRLMDKVIERREHAEEAERKAEEAEQMATTSAYLKLSA
jgi:TPR repeat protein